MLSSLSKATGSPVLLGDPVFVDAGPIVGDEGFATYHQPAPLHSSLIGTKLFFQWVSGEPGNESWSNGAELTPFGY